MNNSNISMSDIETFLWPPPTTASSFNFLSGLNMSSNFTSNFNGYIDYDVDDDNVSSSITDIDRIHTSDSIGARIAATLTPIPTNIVYGSGSSGEVANYTVCNYTDPYCLDDGWLRHSISGTVIYCVAYFTVFVLGVVGNSFVVAVVWRTPRMRTVTNYFIVNLALADLLVIILCLPATLLSNIFIPWVLGWFMCKTVAYVQGLSVAASIYSLVAVSFDRFLAISYPLRCQLTRARAKIVIVIIWAVASVIPVPWAMYFDLDEISPDHPGLYICQESWPSTKAENLYFGIGNLLLCYLLPLLIISYCYIMIWARVCSRSIIGETKDGQMENMMQKSKVKVIKMLVVVVFFFMLSWLPLYIIFARVKFGSELGPVEVKSISIIAPVAQWMGSANSCINPILYAFFNNKFRKGFVDIVKSRQCCGKMGRKYEDEFCSTFRRTDFQKSRQWRHETQVDFVSTSGL